MNSNNNNNSHNEFGDSQSQSQSPHCFVETILLPYIIMSFNETHSDNQQQLLCQTVEYLQSACRQTYETLKQKISFFDLAVSSIEQKQNDLDSIKHLLQNSEQNPAFVESSTQLLENIVINKQSQIYKNGNKLRDKFKQAFKGKQNIQLIQKIQHLIIFAVNERNINNNEKNDQNKHQIDHLFPEQEDESQEVIEVTKKRVLPIFQQQQISSSHVDSNYDNSNGSSTDKSYFNSQQCNASQINILRLDYLRSMRPQPKIPQPSKFYQNDGLQQMYDHDLQIIKEAKQKIQELHHHKLLLLNDYIYNQEQIKDIQYAIRKLQEKCQQLDNKMYYQAKMKLGIDDFQE